MTKFHSKTPHSYAEITVTDQKMIVTVTGPKLTAAQEIELARYWHAMIDRQMFYVLNGYYQP